MTDKEIEIGRQLDEQKKQLAQLRDQFARQAEELQKPAKLWPPL